MRILILLAVVAALFLSGCTIHECECGCRNPQTNTVRPVELTICELNTFAEGVAAGQACNDDEVPLSCACEDTDETCNKDPKRDSASLTPTPDSLND